jgi:hypothetical protein
MTFLVYILWIFRGFEGKVRNVGIGHDHQGAKKEAV